MSRRPQQRRPVKRRPAKRHSSGDKRLRIALLVAAVVLFATGIYFGVQIGKPPPPPDFAALGSEPSTPPSISTPEVVADLEHDATRASITPPTRPPQDSPSLPPPVPSDGAPRIALVIDDLGRSLQDIDTLGALDIPITYAVLPFESQTPAVVAKLQQRGEEILCHLPMEAKGGNNPGPGALLSAMSEDELRAATEKALAAVPGAVGVNNHMGSSIASDPRAIETVMSVVASSRLYFLDSRTSVDTLAYSTARKHGLPAGERQVFLDSDRDPAAIEAQFDRLIQLARQRGSAIAIAHPYQETLQVLAEQVPQAMAEGVRFVRTSELLDR